MTDFRCIVCQGESCQTMIYPNTRGDLFKGMGINVCTGCHLGVADRELDPDALADYYANSFAAQTNRTSFPAPVDYFADRGKMYKINRPLGQIALASRFVSEPPERILDFGAGFGTTLHLAKEDHWPAAKLTAIEPDPNMWPYLEHIGAKRVDALDALDSASFDLIFTSHVLEHLQAKELPSAVKHLKDKLKPGGILVAEVPNADLIDYPQIYDLHHEPHLIFFSVKSVTKLFRACAFDLRFVSTTGTSYKKGLRDRILRRLRRLGGGDPDYGPHRSNIRWVARA
jgi:SAM-dependent methyltransferase